MPQRFDDGKKGSGLEPSRTHRGWPRATVSNRRKVATADPKDFFDNRFLKELEKNGFLKALLWATANETTGGIYL
jgi:hypothetical protein